MYLQNWAIVYHFYRQVKLPPPTRLKTNPVYVTRISISFISIIIHYFLSFVNFVFLPSVYFSSLYGCAYMHYYCIIHASLLFVKSLMCKYNIQHTRLESMEFLVVVIFLSGLVYYYSFMYQKKPSSLVVHFIVRKRDIYESGRTNVCIFSLRTLH